LALAARQNGIACLDFYHPFFDETGAIQDRYFLEDGLHPNETGHRLMAEKAAALLKRQFNLHQKNQGVKKD
jgi:lysophospholipase L1-like esterase